MRNVRLNGDAKLSATVTEHASTGGAEEDSVAIPRRMLELDGLHAGTVRGAPVSSASSRERDGRDLLLLALVSSARHEVRAPLQSIQGFAELLAAESYGPLGDEQRVFVDHITQSGADLSRSIDACFELVQLELFRPTFTLGPVRLRGALDEAVELARLQNGLTIDVSFPASSAELHVWADNFVLKRAVSAVFTALSPLMRGAVSVDVHTHGREVELWFGSSLIDGRVTWRSLADVSRRHSSARALLWLRLASLLLERTAGTLETAEGYNRVRIALPIV